MRRVRSFSALGVAGALSVASSVGAAPATQAACIDAYTEGQELERAGALLQARARLLVCAQEPCSKVLAKDCIQWIDDVERKIPTVVLEVRTAGGEEVSDVDVEIDGARLASKLDGRAIELDPGRHLVRVVGRDSEGVVQEVIAREGEKGRRIVVTLATPRATPPEPPKPVPEPPKRAAIEAHARAPWPVYPLVAIGAAALGSFAYFGIRGISDRSDLGSCRGACSADAVSKVRTELLVADVSLGVAVLSLGVATFLWLSTPKATR